MPRLLADRIAQNDTVHFLPTFYGKEEEGRALTGLQTRSRELHRKTNGRGLCALVVSLVYCCASACHRAHRVGPETPLSRAECDRSLPRRPSVPMVTGRWRDGSMHFTNPLSPIYDYVPEYPHPSHTHTLCVSHADFFLCCFSCCTYTPTETGRSLHSKPETLSRWILGATLTVTLR
jgi:hypothetical protein